MIVRNTCSDGPREFELDYLHKCRTQNHFPWICSLLIYYRLFSTACSSYFSITPRAQKSGISTVLLVSQNKTPQHKQQQQSLHNFYQ